ncbi:MAG: hypothetical protein HY293_10670, partial [Planctomycetes bacterium]|nr:hypothetical protein [Planctomycetota bacterium]
MSESRQIREILDRVKIRFRMLTLASVIAGLAAAILLALSFEVALDQLFSLPRWFRVLALLGGLSAAGWIGHRLLAGPLSGQVNDLFLARSIEGRYANLKSGLITYVQLSSEGEESAALRELVGERVSEDLGSIRPDVVIPSRDAKRKSLFLAGAAAIVLILVLVSPSGFWFSFRRTLLPIRDVTETRIAQVLPGNAVAYKGKDVEVAVLLEGKRPPSARLRVTRASAEPVKYELPLRKDGWYRCLLPGVTEDFTYSFAAHDAASDEYRIRIAEVPRLKSLAATLHFPKYTAFPPRRQDTGNIDAIEGTTVVLEGTATRPLSSAALVMKGKRVPTGGLRSEKFGFQFTLSESLDYSIELSDREGTADPEPSKFRVVVRKDAAPQVTLTIPGKNVEVAAPGPLRLACRVVDDFGISSLVLTARVNGKVPKLVPLPVPKERLFVSEPVLDLPALEVGAGDYVEYFLTATDNKEPLPQTGQSATYIVTVQSSLPLLTFSDAHPDVRVEKYRDPLDRKGSVEPRADKPIADDRTKDQGKSQERAENEAGRDDAMSKLLQEKKDLIEKLLAKAGKDAAGDARSQKQGHDTAETREGDGKVRPDDAAPSDGNDGAGKDASDDTARSGEGRKSAKAGAGSKTRAGKNGKPGEGAEPGEGATEGGEEGAAGEPGAEKGQGSSPGASAKGNPRTGRQPGKPGRAGRKGGGDGSGEPGDGDDESPGDDDDNGDDLTDLFPFDPDYTCKGDGRGNGRGQGGGGGRGSGGRMSGGGKKRGGSSGGGGGGQEGAGGGGLGNGGKGGGSGVKDLKEGSGSSSDAGPGGSSGGGTLKAGTRPDGSSYAEKGAGETGSSKGGTLQGSGQELRGGGKPSGGGGDKITGVGGEPGKTSRVDDLKGIGNNPHDVKLSNGKGQGNEEGSSGGSGFGTMSGIKNRKEKGPDDPQPSKLQSVGEIVKELDLQLQSGKVDPRVLKTLQVGEDEVRDFVTRYKKSQADLQRAAGRNGTLQSVTERATDRRAGKVAAGAGDGRVRIATDAVGGESQDLLEG